MAIIDCKTEPQLTNVETCPEKCGKTCTNGYCDCETGECLCDPGFAGPNCLTDICAAAGCVHGNCVAKYLGGDLPVTNKPCVCINGWYGEKCDTREAPILPPYIPNCFNGCYYYLETTVAGSNLQTISNADGTLCCSACQANQACNSWVLTGGQCYLKSGTQLSFKTGCISGIKCSSENVPTTNAPVLLPTLLTTTTVLPEHLCHNGCFYYYDQDISGGNLQTLSNTNSIRCCAACNDNPSCNSWTVFGSFCYLKTGTQRVYRADRISGIKCVIETTSNQITHPPTNAVTTTSYPCTGFCKGDFPFGCRTAFEYGFCNAGGGCSYSLQTSPNWCCYKGC